MKKDSLRHKKFTAVIRIRNLSIPQSIALEDMLATWQVLGSAGASRWTSFFADGDGDFRPKILYNGQAPRITSLIDEETKWSGSKYKIDYDSIGWKLHDNEDLRVTEAKKFNIFRILFGTIRFCLEYTIIDIKLYIRSYKIRKSDKSRTKLPKTMGVSCEPPESPSESNTCDCH
jgi:hypothetical protein